MAYLSFLGNIFNPSGGTAASQPTGTNVYQTNIPQYAQPYVQNMMNATQAQIFQTDASGNVTGFNQYQPYSGMDQTAYNNASQAVAGFSPLQQQAQSSAANLQMPGQYGTATNLATASGLGALGTTGQAGMYGGMGNMAGQQAAGMSNAYGGLGAMAGQQGANIGASLGQMSTNPNAVGAYMNPYIQNALNPALQLSNQQYGMMGQQEQANATKVGAFGGTREALMAGLNQQNQMLANNQLIGNAYNTAYGQAQQQMNAANQAALSGNAQALQGYGMGLQGAGQAGQLGIQGAQTGLQGVGAQQAGYGQAGQAGATLAGIGGQQLGAQQNIINQQAAQGAAQQANAQQIINQGIQNYATAQQYPLMQLGTMSNMLHGLPMQAATTQQYQAAPSALNQAVGVAGIAGSLAGARGGLPSEFKKGIKGYAVGGVIGGTQSDLEDMPTDALQKEMSVTQSPTIKNQIKQILQARAGAQYAGGGIIAFSDGNDGEAIKEDPTAVRQAYIDAANMQKAQNSSLATPVNSSRFAAMGTPTSRFSNDQNASQSSGLTTADIRAGRTTPQAPTPGTAAAARLGITSVQPSTQDWQGSANVASAPTTQQPSVQAPPPAQQPPAQPPVQPTTAPGAITNASQKPKVNIPAVVAEKVSNETVKNGNNPEIEGYLKVPTEAEKNAIHDAYMAKLQSYLGPDDSAERLAKLDKRLERETKMYDKNQKLVYASMWAKIGSTPGSLIQATLAGIQHAIPQIISNDERRNQALNAIDDAKAEVNKAKRAEALQKWDIADKHTSKAVDHILKSSEIQAQDAGHKMQYKAAIYKADRDYQASTASTAQHAESNRLTREAREDAKLRDQVNVINGQLERIQKDNKDIYDMANMALPANATKQMKDQQTVARNRIKELEKDVRSSKADIENKILERSGKTNTDDPLGLRKK